MQQDLSCFSETYDEAREKFKSAASALAADLHPLIVTKDEHGEYTMDVAVVKGSGSSLVVLTSATHGVEGFAGSAIQTSILKGLAERRSTPLVPTVVLIHAVNPWGMAYFRRVNENNVDLNRNALLPRHFEQLSRHDRLSKDYTMFSPVANPKGILGWFYLRIGSWFHQMWYIWRYGASLFRTAVISATYSQPKGLFYGGQELQRSHVNIRDFMSKHFGHLRADQVGWVDIHTGLGPCGVDVLMGDTRNQAEFEPLFPKVPGEFDGFETQDAELQSIDAKIQFRCEQADSPSAGKNQGACAGYEYTVGSVDCDEWLNQFFRKDTGSVAAVTQEFGTLPTIFVVRALIFENAGFHYDRARRLRWQALLRDAFYVRTPDWKTRILRRGHDVFEKFVARCSR